MPLEKYFEYMPVILDSPSVLKSFLGENIWNSQEFL